MNSIEIAAEVTLWTCLFLIAYAYAGYPMDLWLLARWLGKKPLPPAITEDDLPTLSVLIAAHNEEEVIDERIRNALALDYPADKLEIVIASDCSSDETCDIVRNYAHRGIRLLQFERRQGKAGVLNESIHRVSGEIVLLSDANTFFKPDAAQRLVRWFEDPFVAAVCGKVHVTDPRTGSNVDGLYWKYECFLKEWESRLGVVLGANGAIYAVRRSSYIPVPEGTIIDDFVIPLLPVLSRGSKLLYDDTAIAVEEAPADIGSEFRRRARIGAGGFQSLRMLWPLLNPTRGRLAFAFFCHKALRWIGPFLLLTAVLSNLALLASPGYAALLLLQSSFYLTALLMGLVPARIRALKPLRLTTMFASMNAALFVGFWRWALGLQGGAWQCAARAIPEKEAIA